MMALDDDLSRIDQQASQRWLEFHGGPARRAFVRLASRVKLTGLTRQRVKMLYFAWAYWRLFTIPGIHGFRLLRQFLRIDFNVQHGHLPSEIVKIARSLAERRARPGEVFVEAGCWQGGSSAKFSLLCEQLGYRLLIFDSFEGVEVLSDEKRAKEWDYAGQYASPESVLWQNLARYGRPAVCTSTRGWFSQTLAKEPVKEPIRLAYIDCDLAAATGEALQGVIPSLVTDGCIYTQDFHITPVRTVLLDKRTWESLRKPVPRIRSEGVHLARIDWVD